MGRVFDWIFREDETLSPRAVVASGLFAYAILILRPVIGSLYFFLLPLVVFALALVCYAALRLIMPMMDPADPDADRFVVYGGAALIVATGILIFGVWFIPALIGGGALVAWRAPELLDSLPKLPHREE